MSKTITRKYIQRITKREGNTNIRQSGGGGGGGGGASQYWVEENYISKLFFNQLFTVYDEDGNIVEPNDTESVIASIKSMFGFWTDAYLSALGNGEGGGAELTIASLADVDVHGVANGQALVYDATTQKWVPGQGGGIDITAMWAALAQSGVQQIDASHLATALTGYATETWVGNQGYITGSALNGYATESWVGSQISDMATQTWVSGNYLSQTNAAATYLTQTNAAATYLTKTDAATTYVSIAFFERLFKAYNGSTVVHPNNTTSTIDNIKAMFGFWTDFYLSALGNGSGGSTPGVTMAQVWSALGNSTTEQINATHLTNALSGYNPTSNFKTINGNSIIGTGDIVIQGGGGTGTVTAVKVGTTTYSPTDGVVSLPAYPSTLDDIADGSTRKLANYLPLSGGTMTGAITLNYGESGQALAYSTVYDQILRYNGNIYLNTRSNRIAISKMGTNGLILDISNIPSGAITQYFQAKNGTIALTSDLSSYLPLSGGTMTGAITLNYGESGQALAYSTVYDQILRYNGNIYLNTRSNRIVISKMGTNGLILDISNIPSGAITQYFQAKDGTIALTSDLSSYLPLSGGTMTGTLNIQNNGYAVNIQSTNSAFSGIGINIGTTLKGEFAYRTPTYGMYMYNHNYQGMLGLKDDGTPYVGKHGDTLYTLLHSNNYSTFLDSAYLPLSGGKMTGNHIWFTSSSYYSNSENGICFYDNTINMNVNNGKFAISKMGTNGFVFDINGFTKTKTVYINSTGGFQPESNNTVTLGGLNSEYAYFDSRVIFARHINGSRTFSEHSIYINYSANDMPAGNTLINANNDNKVGIGTTSPSYKLHVAGTFYASGNSSIGGTLGVTGATTLSSTLSVTSNTTVGGTLGVTGATTLSSTLSVSGNSTLSGYVGVGTAASSSYALKVSGVAYASTGVYSGGYVTALSDIRHKDVKGNVGLTVSEVANAPAVKFLWKDRRQVGMQVGSIAQYWKKVMPEAIVENADGELTMSYGVIALLASIATARKVEDHERRIRELEEENKKLKQQLNAA